LLSILPELVDNVTKVLPIVDSQVDILTKVLSVIDLQADTINNTYIKYLAENHVYIINMQKMALNILTVKVNVKPTIGST